MGGRMRQLAQRSDGFTLPELMIATVAMLTIAVTALGLMMTVTRMQPQISERSAEVQQARVMIERISRELRQGYGIDQATPTDLVVLTYSADCGTLGGNGAVACRVTYSCGSGTCTRQASAPDGSGAGPTVELVSGLRSDQVFAPGAAYLGIELSYPAERGDDSVTLADGVALRNMPSGGA